MKPIRKSVFVIVYMICPLVLISQNQEDGLIAHWTLDGHALDASPSGFNGEVFNAVPATDRFGKKGRAMYFDGNSYINFGDILKMGFQDYTLSAWFKIREGTSLENELVIVSKARPREATRRYALVIRDERPGAVFVKSWYSARNLSPLIKGKWYLLTAVYDRNDRIKLFLNGKIFRSADISDFQNYDMNENWDFRIGNYYEDERNFIGDLDDVRVYNRALEEEEVFDLYNQSKLEEAPSVSFDNAAVGRRGSFQLEKGEKYVVSCWVSEPEAFAVASYQNTKLGISFDGGTTVELYDPSGAIIDGWQQIVGEFTVPEDAAGFEFSLLTTHDSGSSYFDDLRIFPFEGNMKSFVYDPVTQRLVAELDEQNFATFYEYDKEGGLVRVKKETGKGVYTIQESRSSNAKNKQQ